MRFNGRGLRNGMRRQLRLAICFGGKGTIKAGMKDAAEGHISIKNTVHFLDAEVVRLPVVNQRDDLIGAAQAGRDFDHRRPLSGVECISMSQHNNGLAS